nr:RNA-directed DNA polymerase, eukaryota [Tanacetum cinerariifolium]
MIVVVYAPQEASEKRMLWDYLTHVSDQWDGEIVMMGDFNEESLLDDVLGFDKVMKLGLVNSGSKVTNSMEGFLNSYGVLLREKLKILSFPDNNTFSYGASSRKEDEHDFVTAEMILCPGGEFHSLNDSQPSMANVDLKEILKVPYQIGVDTCIEGTPSSMMEETSPEGVQEVKNQNIKKKWKLRMLFVKDVAPQRAYMMKIMVWSPLDTLGETITINIPKTKSLHVGTLCWSSWGDEGYLKSRGNDDGVLSAQELRSSVSLGGGKVMSPQEEKQCLLKRRRSSVSSGRKVTSPQKEEQCLLKRRESDKRSLGNYPPFLDHLVKNDLEISRTWMNLRCDSRQMLSEINNSIFEDMINDIILSLVNDHVDDET